MKRTISAFFIKEGTGKNDKPIKQIGKYNLKKQIKNSSNKRKLILN